MEERESQHGFFSWRAPRFVETCGGGCGGLGSWLKFHPQCMLVITIQVHRIRPSFVTVGMPSGQRHHPTSGEFTHAPSGGCGYLRGYAAANHMPCQVSNSKSNLPSIRRIHPHQGATLLSTAMDDPWPLRGACTSPPPILHRPATPDKRCGAGDLACEWRTPSHIQASPRGPDSGVTISPSQLH
jgi:hypothetical protein